MGFDNRDSDLSVTAGRPAEPRIVTAFFDTQDAAEAAHRDLIAGGVRADSVTLLTGASATPEAAPSPGLWESLKAMFLPDDDRHVYAEGLRRGGVALSVETDDASYDRAIDILDRDGAVDMEERAAGWRGEGWSATERGEHEMAYAPAGTGTGGFAASRADQPLFDGPIDTAAIEPGQVAPSGAAPMTPGSALERDVTHGRKRVWSYLGGGGSEVPPGR